jgi:hypothetical protein
VVEGLRNQLTGAFSDLAGTLDGAYPYILAGFSSTFADVLGSASGMQCRQVAGPFTNAFGSLSRALACAFADVTAAAADITAAPRPWVAGADWAVLGCVAGA